MKLWQISIILFVLILQRTNAAIKSPGWKHCIHPLHALPGQWNKITSPGFPNGINTQIQCSWMITANPGYRIKMAFHTLNMTGSRKSCFTQFVEIQDYKIGHSVGKFCGASRPGDYVSWGPRVRFDLQGDTSGAKTKGFDLRYKATKEPGGFKSSWTFPLKPKRGPKNSKPGKPKGKGKGPGGSTKPRRPGAGGGGAGRGSPKAAGGPPKKATPVEEIPPALTPKKVEPQQPRVPKQQTQQKPVRRQPPTPAPGSRIDFRPPPPPRQGPIIYGENSNRRGVDHGHSSVITMAEDDDEEPLNIYIIAGVAAGGVVALTLIFILMKICIFDKNKKRKQRRKEQERAKSAAGNADNFHMTAMPGAVPEQYMTEQIVPQLQSYHHMQPLPMMSQTMSRHHYPHTMYPPPMQSAKSRTAPPMMVPPSGLKSSRSRARSVRSRVSRKDEMRRSKSRSSMRNSRSRSSIRRSKSRSMQAIPNMEGWVMVDPRYQPGAVIKNPYPHESTLESSDLSSSSGWASDSTDSYRPKSQRRAKRPRSLPRMRSQPPTYESATGRPYYVIEKSRDFDEGYDTGRRTTGTKSASSKKRREKSRNSKTKDRRRKYSH